MRRAGFALLALWAVLSIGALAEFLYGNTPVRNYELVELLVWQVLTLNFPVSVPLSWFISAEPVATWCWFTFAGFVQWAILVPALVGALRRQLSRRQPGEER